MRAIVIAIGALLVAAPVNAGVWIEVYRRKDLEAWFVDVSGIVRKGDIAYVRHCMIWPKERKKLLLKEDVYCEKNAFSQPSDCRKGMFRVTEDQWEGTEIVGHTQKWMFPRTPNKQAVLDFACKN